MSGTNLGSTIAIGFVCLVITAGMVKIKEVVQSAAGRGRKDATDTVAIPPKMRALVSALKVGGYFGEVRRPDEQEIAVDDPVITEMIEVLDREMDIVWMLPELRLRLKPADSRFNQRFNWMLLTPTHAIGFNRKERHS